jgi:uncharacterized integral membrane protein
MDAEMDAIRSKEDIVSLHNGREWASFDGGVETLIGQVDHILTKLFKLETPPLQVSQTSIPHLRVAAKTHRQRYFRTPELRAKTSNKFIAFYSSSRIDKLVNVLITFVIFILLVIPVITMYHLTSTSAHVDPSASASNSTASAAAVADANNRDTFNAVGVLIVFTLLFSAAMSLLTKAARHELFAASAAYCAILVVFIGNFTGPGN